MNRASLKPTRSHTVALLAIVMLLWLNFAYIDHQYDRSSTHHSQHDCQLFACGLHGASAAVATLTITPLTSIRATSPVFHFFLVSIWAYHARSPPKVDYS
ncbi:MULTISPECIES: DUF2607 family protein [Vibrio]|uniref:DUF2607 family protein n=1 Tax=Vibrio TaxID=662 RepID=UPI001FE21F07|nr:DUF2607 family protein [Vibrio pacinii]